MTAQRRVYHKRKGICENNRGVENVTVWYVGKIVATGGRSTPRQSIYNKGGGLATRLYTSLGPAALQTPRGLFFPGDIEFPPRATQDDQKKERNRRALEEARKWEKDPNTLWTDGSAFPPRVAAAAVVGFVEPDPAGPSPGRVRITARRPPGAASRGGIRARGTTYGTMTRSIARTEEGGAFRSEAWSLGAQSSAFDAEV